jgi:glycosyltransferase involved in cell wall biosynthesis
MGSRAFLIPSYNPGPRLARVVLALQNELDRAQSSVPIIIVDDGSTDDSLATFDTSGLVVIKHERNLGKGAALKSGLKWAQTHGISQVVTLDADGQHPARGAMALLQSEAPPSALVLAVRDMVSAGAPRANQWSNRFSNRVLSFFGGRRLLDTQCGLRRYPVEIALALGAPDDGYAFESDLVLRAARRGVQIVHLPFEVFYPPESERLSYFDSLRDPAKMVYRVVATSLTVRKRAVPK